MKTSAVIITVLGFGLTAFVSMASTITPAQEKFFETHIRPALVQYCYDCHSVETGKNRGGLLLDTQDGMLQGGDSGNVLSGDHFSQSLFWKAINWTDLEMPPKEKMPAETIQRFKEWLSMGAPDPRRREKLVVESKVDIEAGRQHWAYQAPMAPTGATIDSLVNASLAEAGLTPSGKADPATLLRRLYIDLVGIPPTPEEVVHFEKAWSMDAEAAIESKVDDLLRRPQFGERWGRHWLDVARYAESTGKDVNVTYPHAWRYRDYVIDSFNADKPYDEFIREQVAGDLLKVKSDKEWQENLIATGFLTMGTKGLNETNPRQFKMEVVDEQIDTLSQAVLGLTVSCARCHDHKYDPIPTTDYYALAGILTSTRTLFGTVPSAQNKRAANLIELPIADPVQALKGYSEQEIAQMRQQIDQVQQNMRTMRNDPSVSANMLAGMRRRVLELQTKLATLDGTGVPATMAMAVQDDPQPADIQVLLRGDVEKPAQEVKRGFLQVLPGGGPAKIREGESGRRELAEWLTSEENPLTARVMVNRIWLHLFGQGLVGSPNNWGKTGQAPSHPELLDLLAVRFMEGGWSIKSMVRSMVLSDAYQRSSAIDLANYEKDPDNRLLWRMSPRPMDAEVLRDSILAMGGGLELRRPYGSQVSEFGDMRVGRGFGSENLKTDVRYRSVYLPVLRGDVPEALSLFDFADPNLSKPEREMTNVPSQALYLMNDVVILNESLSMARALMKKHSSTEAQVREAFLRAFGREPSEADMAAAVAFFRDYRPVRQEVTRVAASQQQGSRFQGGQGRNRPQGGSPRQGMAGGRQGMRQGRGGMAGMQGIGGPIREQTPVPPAPTLPVMTAQEQTLAMFCQALIASAEFRILN